MSRYICSGGGAKYSSACCSLVNNQGIRSIIENDEGSIIVLGRNLEGRDLLLGYCYSYCEDWNEASRHKRSLDIRTSAPSVYIAELFVSRTERGNGFGGLLLSAALKNPIYNSHTENVAQLFHSHLYVSSQNHNAAEFYRKFGFRPTNQSSGDEVHDSVLNLKYSGSFLMQTMYRFTGQCRSRSRSCRVGKPKSQALVGMTLTRSPRWSLNTDSVWQRSEFKDFNRNQSEQLDSISAKSSKQKSQHIVKTSLQNELESEQMSKRTVQSAVEFDGLERNRIIGNCKHQKTAFATRSENITQHQPTGTPIQAAKPRPRGRSINPNSARQRLFAIKAFQSSSLLKKISSKGRVLGRPIDPTSALQKMMAANAVKVLALSEQLATIPPANAHYNFRKTRRSRV